MASPPDRDLPQRPRYRRRRAENRRSEGLKAVADLLPDLAERGGWGALVELCRLQAAWPDVVGAAVAVHTAPERIGQGRLTVRVDSSAWLMQLSFFKAEILRKVNGILGEGRVQEVFLQVGRVDRSPDKRPRRPDTPLSAEALRAVEAQVAPVPDEGVREALKALLLKDLRRGRGSSGDA
jgi:hypothetical protein